jgi:DNA-directed RNA polymerase subunit RPC12/RpoP
MLIVVCKTARDPLRHERMTLGYKCALCEEPLQVSPTALDAIKAGGRALCNPCGIRLVKETPVEELAGFGLSEEALAQLDERIAKMRAAKDN